MGLAVGGGSQGVDGAEVEDVFGVDAQDFGGASGGGGQAAGVVGAVAVEEFVDLPVAAAEHLVEASLEHGECLRAGRLASAVDADEGADERAEQPGVDGALVVGAVAGDDGAAVAALVFGRAGRKASEAQGREQLFADGREDGGVAVEVEDRVSRGVDWVGRTRRRPCL